MNRSRPSLDDRYAVGHCPRCTPEPKRNTATGKMVPAVRSTITLIRADLYDPGVEVESRRRKRERLVIRRAAGLTKGRPTKAELDEAASIHERWAREAHAGREPTSRHPRRQGLGPSWPPVEGRGDRGRDPL